MSKCESLIAASILCILLAASSPGSSQADPPGDGTAGVAISLVEKKLTETMLQLRYQIRNDSDGDIWICRNMDERGKQGFRAYVGRDGGTLVVQRRLKASVGDMGTPPPGRYARLPRGQTRSEVMSFELPVHVTKTHSDENGSASPARVSRLFLAIGYCERDLPTRASSRFGRGERIWDDQLVISWDDAVLNEEKILSMTVEDLTIPYHRDFSRPTPIHLSPCKRIEVHFTKSPLAFFFPHAQQQALLSSQEKAYLQSLHDFIIDERHDMLLVASEASEAIGEVFFTDGSQVDLTCHRRDGSIVPLTVYDDAYIVTAEGQVFRCHDGLTALRRLTAQIRSLDARVQCAANLKELWHFLWRDRGISTPIAGKWCDSVARGDWVCPGASEGRCHYAMNPKCRRDSPGDVVLLFETQAGWNQQGGPELFTWKNHDHRGGCILLNDGTVKFIRTEDELHRLRWE